MRNSILTFGYANYGLMADTRDNVSGQSDYLDNCRAQSYTLTLNRQSDIYKKFNFQYGMGINSQILTTGYNSSSQKLQSINDDVRIRKTNFRIQSLVQVGYNIIKFRNYDLGIGAGLQFNGTIINSTTSERYIGVSSAPDTISVVSNNNKNFVSNIFYSLTVSPKKRAFRTLFFPEIYFKQSRRTIEYQLSYSREYRFGSLQARKRLINKQKQFRGAVAGV